MDNERPVSDGKALQQAAEKAYDTLAEEHGLDEHGDSLAETDDDGPALRDDGEEVDDAPAARVDEQGGEPAAAAPSAEELLPPHTWRAEWKEAFQKITDPTIRAAIIEQNRNMNAAFTQRMTELAGIKRKLVGVESAVQPHMDRLSRAGIQPEVAVQRALAWDAHMQRDPRQGLLDYAKAYGVDLTEAMQPAQDQEYLTPFERQAQQALQGQAQTVQQMQQQLAQWQQHQQQQVWAQRQANAQAMLNEFMNATDEAGNRKYLYIEHVAPLMADLIRRNAVDDLDTAYRVAVARTPEVQAALERSRNVARVQGSRQMVEKVRKASSGIVAKTGRPGKGERDLESQVSAAYDKIVKTA